MAHLKEEFKEFKTGGLIQAGEQAAEIVEGGLRGIEDPQDPRFLELGGFGATQKVSQDIFSQFQTGAAFQVHPAVNDTGDLSIDKITAAGTAAEKLAGVQALQAAEAEKAAIGKVGAEEERASLLQQFKDFFTQRESIAGIQEKEKQALGVPDVLKQQLSLISEISGLNTQFITINAEEQAELDALDRTSMRQSVFEGTRENIIRKFQRKKANLSAQIGAKAITLQALQGFIGQARQLVNDVVNAVTFDQQLELNKLTTFMDFNEDQIAQFDKTIKSFLDTLVVDAQKELEDRKEEVKSIVNLIVDAAEQGVVLAIDPRTSTLEEATEAFAEAVAPLSLEEPELRPDIQEYKEALTLGLIPADTSFLGYIKLKSEAERKPAGGGVLDVGLVSAILSNPALFNTLTPSAKTALLPELVKSGFTPVRELPIKQTEGFASFDSVSGLVDRLDTLLDEGVNIGPAISKISRIGGLFGQVGGTESFRNISEDLFRTILKATSGVAASEKEVERLKSFIPKVNDTEAIAEQKIVDFRTTLREVEFDALQRFRASNFDITGHQAIFDNKLIFEKSNVDFGALQEKLKEGEVLAINRFTGDIEAITEREYQPNLHLIVE